MLNILGKALYAPADALLHHGVGIESTMLRYRIVMSICTFFCFYGVVQVTRSPPPPPPSTRSSTTTSTTATAHSSTTTSTAVTAHFPTAGSSAPTERI